jgi:hypothetical protein
MVTNMLLDFFKMLKTKDRGGKRNGIKHNMPFHALQIQLCLHVCACLMSASCCGCALPFLVFEFVIQVRFT